MLGSSKPISRESRSRIYFLSGVLLFGQGAAAADWRPAGWEEAAASTALLAGTLLAEGLSSRPNAPRWTSRNPLDESVRDSWRLDSTGARAGVARATDVGMGVLIAAPVAGAGVALLGRGDEEDETSSPRSRAWQLLVVDLEGFAGVSLATFATKSSFARERPYMRDCSADGLCDAKDRFQSFVSGHTSFSFTSAGLVCAHGVEMRAYGSLALGGGACAAAVVAATAVGAGRVLADRHYITDVLAGAALGGFSGFALPLLLHRRSPIQVSLAPRGLGFQASVAF